MAAHFISRPVVPASEKFVFVYICVIAESRRIHKIYPDLIITDRHGVVTTVPFVAVIVAAFTVSRLKAAYHRMSAVYGLTELCYGDILTLLCTYSLKFPAKTEPPSVIGGVMGQKRNYSVYIRTVFRRAPLFSSQKVFAEVNTVIIQHGLDARYSACAPRALQHDRNSYQVFRQPRLAVIRGAGEKRQHQDDHKQQNPSLIFLHSVPPPFRQISCKTYHMSAYHMQIPETSTVTHK